MPSFKMERSRESHIANYTGMIDHVYVTNTSDQERPSKKVRWKLILESDMVVLGPGSSLPRSFQI